MLKEYSGDGCKYFTVFQTLRRCRWVEEPDLAGELRSLRSATVQGAGVRTVRVSVHGGGWQARDTSLSSTQHHITHVS